VDSRGVGVYEWVCEFEKDLVTKYGMGKVRDKGVYGG
jgi:hypothetical protein